MKKPYYHAITGVTLLFVLGGSILSSCSTSGGPINPLPSDSPAATVEQATPPQKPTPSRKESKQSPTPNNPTPSAEPSENINTPPARNPSPNQYQWYYDHLGTERQALYRTILAGVQKHEPSIKVNKPIEMVEQVHNSILSDHPELFYLSRSYHYRYSKENPALMLSYEPKYLMTAQEAQTKTAAVDAVLNPVLDNIRNTAKSGYEMEVMAHDWIIRTMDYDNSISNMNTDHPVQTVYGGVLNRKSNCMGYSYTMKYMMDKLGIPSMVLVGDGTSDKGTEKHQWNMVQVNGAWYHVDVCWDDPVYTDSTARDISGDTVFHGYLNATDGQMVGTHTPKNTEYGLPAPPVTPHDSTAVSWYVRNGLNMGIPNDFKNLLVNRFPAMMNNHEKIQVQFTSKAVLDETIRNMGSIMQEAGNASGWTGGYKYYYLIGSGNVLLVTVSQ